MTNQRTILLATATAFLSAALTGCADDSRNRQSDPTPTPSAPSSSAPATSSSAPTDSTSAEESASTAVRDYFNVVDQLRQRSKRPISTLNSVATSGELSALTRLIRSERQEGRRQIGDTQIVELKVQNLNLDNSDPKSGQVPTAQVDVCWDVSEVDVIDATGESIVTSTRADRGWIRFTVANYRWSKNPTNAWRVASSEDLKQEPCTS